ncbi:MAG: hypothetical protein KGS44_16590 [Alphaproteobacteria bacterium]|nr:hypothetical protein [Alphaproteobacteria bacterium]
MDKGHGRIETRTLTASTEAVGYLRWPGAAQILRIQRHRWITGKQSVDVAYASYAQKLVTAFRVEVAYRGVVERHSPSKEDTP